MQDQDDQLHPQEFFTEFKLNHAWEEVKTSSGMHRKV